MNCNRSLFDFELIQKITRVGVFFLVGVCVAVNSLVGRDKYFESLQGSTINNDDDDDDDVDH